MSTASSTSTSRDSAVRPWFRVWRENSFRLLLELAVLVFADLVFGGPANMRLIAGYGDHMHRL